MDNPSENLIIDPGRWYYYVCIDNRLFIEVLSGGEKKDTLGLTYLNKSCKCIEEEVVTKNFFGKTITETKLVLKIEKDKE